MSNADVRHVHIECYGFFFQAEDGIRDSSVTGVETCALPILIADDLLAHLAAAVNQIRFRNLEGAVAAADIGSRIARGREIHAEALDELFVALLIGVDADAQHNHALRAHLPLERSEARHFLHPGGAPEVPRIPPTNTPPQTLPL